MTDATGGDPAGADASVGEPSDLPRGRSEPPPRPPPPAGITALRRDAITVALSGDGRFLAAGDLAGQALLWDLSRGRFVWADPTPQGNRLGRVVFAARAAIYLAGSFHEPDRPWRFWSAELLERRGELGEPGWLGLDAALDDQGTRALTLSSSRDGAQQRLELWDLADARALVTIPVERSARGAVALDGSGVRFAWADEIGGVKVMALAVEPGAAAVEVFETHSEAGTHQASRVSRLALSVDGAVLHGSIGARLVTWPLGDATQSTSIVVGAAPEAPQRTEGLDPIRGLHRVNGPDGVKLVAVTRPVDGGLRLFAADGRPLGRLETGCRCEIHALSSDAKVAACGCTEAAELRWGLVSFE